MAVWIAPTGRRGVSGQARGRRGPTRNLHAPRGGRRVPPRAERRLEVASAVGAKTLVGGWESQQCSVLGDGEQGEQEAPMKANCCRA